MVSDGERFSILVVDDEQNVLSTVRRTLRRLPVDVETAGSAESALRTVEAQKGRFAVVISDQRMPGMSGDQLLRRLRVLEPNAVRILFTGYTDMDTVIRAINEGQVFRYLQKPWEDAELQGLVLTALQHHKVLAENERLLARVREQEQTMAELERLNPGLTKLPERDESGAFIIEPPQPGSVPGI